MIEIENIHAGYGAKLVLRGVSAPAAAGQFIALLGPNGSGKSTLLKTLCGLISPARGQVQIDGSPCHSLTAKKRAQKISYLAQGREVAAGLKVADILEIGRAPFRGRLGKISAAGYAAIEGACARTDIQKFKDRAFDSLSGGEQARVLLARALAVQAPVILADEPIAALDPLYQISTMEVLKAEAESGTLVIAALHDLALASQYADEIWVMQNGQLIQTGPPETGLSPDILRSIFGIEPPQNGFQVVRRASVTPKEA